MPQRSKNDLIISRGFRTISFRSFLSFQKVKLPKSIKTYCNWKIGVTLDEDKIYLDKNAFKVLASDTRIAILKELDKRPKTVTELSRELNLTKATVYEHLSKLFDAELIIKDEGARHKWVYYKLSKKGRKIFNPQRIKIEIFFISALLAFVGGILEIYRFIEGTLLPMEPRGVPPWEGLLFHVVHDPVHLVMGLALISIGISLLYLALRIGKNC